MPSKPWHIAILAFFAFTAALFASIGIARQDYQGALALIIGYCVFVFLLTRLSSNRS